MTQHGVASGMPKGVVDAFEVIEMEQEAVRLVEVAHGERARNAS